MSIVAWELRAAIAGLVVFLLAASWLLLRRRPILRWGARLLCLPLAVLFAAAAINAHYYYFPTLGALLGRNAADQISQSEFRHMQSSLRLVGGRHGRARSGSRSTALPAHGVVLSFMMPGTASGFPTRTGQVYLPPIWFESPHPHLPVIELLHGSPGSPADWTRGGHADLTADDYAKTHDGFAPILVMPDVNGSWWGDSECVDGRRGRAETYLLVDVRNAVVQTFGARSDGAAWEIAGLSEGGSCALQMGLRHPDSFRAIGDFSGEDHPSVKGGLRKLFWGSTQSELERAEQTYDPRTLLADWHGTRNPAIAFAVGRSDSLRPRIESLYSAARTDHFDAIFSTYRGGHDFRLWGICLGGAFNWMVGYFNWSRVGLSHHHVLASAGHARQVATRP